MEKGEGVTGWEAEKVLREKEKERERERER